MCCTSPLGENDKILITCYVRPVHLPCWFFTNKFLHTGESSDNPQTLLLATNNFLGDGDIWNLDTICSNHMCGKKELFFSLDEMVKSSVKFGNNSTFRFWEKAELQSN